MRGPIRLSGMVAIALLVSSIASPADTHLAFVPWKVLEPGVEPVGKAFTLFWIPASQEEMRHSALITSQRLTSYAARCIGMHVVRADDRPRLAKLNAGETLPLAVLIEGGNEVARVMNESGVLSCNAVEAMVREAFDTREAALNAMLDQAGRESASGEKDAAINLYRQVSAQQCAFPRLAKTAQRALRRLGVK